MFQPTAIMWPLLWWWPTCNNIALNWIYWSNWWEWIQFPVCNRPYSLNNDLIKIIFLQLRRTCGLGLIDIVFLHCLFTLGAGWIRQLLLSLDFFEHVGTTAHVTCSTNKTDDVIWQQWLVFPRLVHVTVFPRLFLVRCFCC